MLDAIIDRIPDPMSFKQANLKKYWSNTDYVDTPLGARALIFDSVYDKYRGVVCYVKVVDGEIRANDVLDFVYSETKVQPTEVGYFTPEYQKDSSIRAGQIGYIVTGQKSVRDAKI